MLMRLLGGGGVPARAIGGAVGEQQRYVGCGEPMLETNDWCVIISPSALPQVSIVGVESSIHLLSQS